MAKILYFDRVTPALQDLFESQKPAGFELAYWHLLSDADREAELENADFLMVAAHKITADMLGKAQKTRFIQKNGIGVDNIDLEAAYKLGIPVSNAPGGNTGAVAEFTIGLIISTYRRLVQLDKATKGGEWLMWDLRPFTYEMAGKVHGIVGFGNIGQETARLSKAFGTKILYYDVNRLAPEKEQALGVVYAPLDEILCQADIVSVHVPLLSSTRNLIGGKELALMKKTAIIVNVARGNIVDEEAMHEALVNNRLLGAAFDVWSSEPVPKTNKLLALDNVIATPHIAAGTRDTLTGILRTGFTNIKRVHDGDMPDFVVNKVTGPRAVK